MDIVGNVRALLERQLLPLASALPRRVATDLASWLRGPASEPHQEQPTAREEAYAHFQNEAGEPQFQHSSVLLWDVLGVSAMSTGSDEYALSDLRRLRAAVDSARTRAGTENVKFLRCSTWFTDNVVTGTPVMLSQDLEMTTGPAFLDAAYMQLYVLREGYLSRGAISFGMHYMDETFVFGPALIEAHELEEDKGGRRWPCVAVTDDVAELAREMAHRYYSDPKESPFARELTIDEQGKVFVDQLGIWLGEETHQSVIDAWVPQYRDLIREKLKELPPGDRVWHKWRWLADYHDYTLRRHGQNRRKFVTGLRAEHKFTSFADTL